ncbi:DUF971 domain-containing protein [Paraburkholderia oxyphila]|uniref:DUF971 domain-containing protein n=1 Tax=Paraburkholderia oxyphila TaxID=614212 RepID=UPI0004801BCA|nr:DUF971 domain-containing protein [Paraburkholderia oxyphila]
MNVPIEILSESGALTLVWPGGERQRLPLASLRRACPCAGCRRARLGGHMNGDVSDLPDDSAHDNLTLSAMVPMGYGVQLVFSDGHDRGIFPWAWLERFAPPAA